MSKPRILVARAIFPDIVDRLREHFDVEANPDDVIWTQQELAARLADKDGAFTTGSQRIDAALLAACPRLRIVALLLLPLLAVGSWQWLAPSTYASLPFTDIQSRSELQQQLQRSRQALQQRWQ